MNATPSTDSNPHVNPLYTRPMEVGNMEIRPLDLLEHVLATGSTGSGKTRSLVLPLVEQVLRRFGCAPAEKAGMLLIDAKGDMVKLAAECAERSGRAKDVFILGEGGNCWFPLFDQFNGDPTAIANFLFETLEDRSGGGNSMNSGSSNDSFWEENARRLLRSALVCAKARHGDSLGGLAGISQGINDLVGCGRTTLNHVVADAPAVAALKEVIADGLQSNRISSNEAGEIDAYIANDVCKGSPNTWGTIANMTRNYLAQFSDPRLRALFEEGNDRRKLGPEDVIDEGLLLIVSLSPVLYGAASTPFRTAIKKAFCDRMLQRDHLETFDGARPRPINQIRPVIMVMDEFHTTLNPKGRSSEPFFLDKVREFRGMCILATQGISAISSVIRDSSLRDHLLNNCRTKFFFANDCPETSSYFEHIGGTEDRKVESINYQRVPAPPRFRLPNHTFEAAGKLAEVSRSLNTVAKPRFKSAELGKLPTGTALVVTKGRKLVRYAMDPGAYGKPGNAVPNKENPEN